MLRYSNPNMRFTIQIQPDRYAWLQVARGTVTLNDERLQAGDGVQMGGGENLAINTETSAEILLFSLV